VVILCAVTLWTFQDNPRLSAIRELAVDTTAGIYAVGAAPAQAWDGVVEYLESRKALREENAQLRQANLVVEAQAQRLAAILAENTRYRALLNSTALIESEVMVAEIISVSADPARHLLVIDKGSRDGVRKGQPLLGAKGLMGQVVLVGAKTSRAMLMTDATHAVPVQVNRNGVRALVEGVGDIDRVIVRHVAATTDIQIGDQLVTSGLGGRFPPGYPVAEVVAIEGDPGAAFSTVIAQPIASLDRGRHVLLATISQPQNTVDP